MAAATDVFVIEMSEMSETDDFAANGILLTEDSIYNAINTIRYEKKKRPDRDSVFKLINQEICVSSFDFNKLLDSMIENGSVNIKETSTKGIFFQQRRYVSR